MAERDPSKPFDRQAAIEQLFRDIDEAKKLAFEKEDDTGRSIPDLAALPKILELQAKCYGLLSSDGKRGADSGGTVEVSLEKVKQLVKAAELKVKEKKNGED